MSITAVIGTLTAALPIFEELSQIRRPAATSWRMARVLRAVQDNLKEYEVERQRLVQELGVSRDPSPEEASLNGGQPVTYIPADKLQQFIEALTPIVMTEVTVNCHPIPLADLGDISARELLALGPFVSAPEENDGG